MAREHFGLAGVIVVVGAGIAFSLTIDLIVLAVKDISPIDFANRLIFAALLLGARVAVSAAVVAVVVFLGTRATRQRDLTLDQSFNAVAFAFAPLIVAPLPALVALFEPNLLFVVGLILLVIGLRVLAGLALNLRAILPLRLAALALVLALASGSIVLGDQVSRVRMTAYAIAPQLASPLSATPAQGKRYDLPDATLTVPEEWVYSVRGIPGEIAHFETGSATLNVVASRPEDLATMDAFADQIARGERLGLSARTSERSIASIMGSSPSTTAPMGRTRLGTSRSASSRSSSDRTGWRSSFASSTRPTSMPPSRRPPRSPQRGTSERRRPSPRRSESPRPCRP